ncbi:MAG: peptidylprolyl isomerase [Planctomycetes bacterium]|nr:peptidylprolyl isomerase [Planctomycetota bacterium]
MSILTHGTPGEQGKDFTRPEEPAPASKEEPRTDGPNLRNPTHDPAIDLELTISCDKTEVDLGEEFTLTATLTNLARDKFYAVNELCYDLRSVCFRVFAPGLDGRLIRMNWERVANSPGAVAIREPEEVSIRPGESLSVSETFPAIKTGELNFSARYCGIRSASPHLREQLASNVVALKVKPHSSGIAEMFVKVETSYDNFTFGFYPDKAYNHVSEFISHVIHGDYDQTKIHRINPQLGIIQGGLIQTPQPASDSIIGPCIPMERSDLVHEAGRLSMARMPWHTDTAMSQFFITTEKVEQFDSPGNPYTVFGYVGHGYDVVQRISRLPRTGETPNTDIVVRKMYLHWSNDG